MEFSKYHFDYYRSTIVLGEWDISRSPDCNEYFCAPPAQAIKVKNIIVHPGYEQKIFRHDIALIVLKEEIKFSGNNITIICKYLKFKKKNFF